jgi:SAM-dependent methyltransferase
MNESGPSTFDQVSYPGAPFAYSHPDHLATLGSLYGMSPAPCDRCRVLELGCGVGANLIPIAHQYPESEFVGIDLSADAIDEANATAADLGLPNVRLLQADIMDVAADYGQFDYVIAHGVYSWVPDEVRTQILSIFRKRLTPQGIAYVSYNSSPGAHLRNLASEIMLFHVRGVDQPRDRIQQGRAILKFLAAVSSEKDIHGLVLRDQLARISQKQDAVLFHDELDPDSKSFWLYEVVERAAQHGLQYLSDADFSNYQLANFPASIRAALAEIPGHDLAARDQYLDFIIGHPFHKTLFCHREVSLRRDVEPTAVKNYHLACALASHDDIDPRASGSTEIKFENGDFIATEDPLIKAAFFHLGRAWPKALDYSILLQRVLQALGRPAESAAAGEEEELANVLFRLFVSGQLSLHFCPPRLTATVSQYPKASVIARKQAETGIHLTTLRHAGVILDNEYARRLLVLTDGTRDLERLATDLNSYFQTAPVSRPVQAEQVDRGTADFQVSPEIVSKLLQQFARLGLLAA